ncbi:hypothetical protein [Asanoa iriomotensis]|uniref:SHOCT domain-containing protein n=1 Tax=Asanoa iriomotensis TaxID=234613 RepID=A0ABQ4CDH7_9ACTN|nr:hypothetical protein [Asanoa iriomotensis]GIF60521.1 hypothetical protein Air01nite_66160 [Asanoa iriomotensis]
MLGHGFGMAYVSFFGVLVIVLLGVVVALFWRAAGRSRSDDDAQRILEERFARGEIGEDEYRRSVELLRSGRLRR